MCGIIGIIGKEDVSWRLVDGLKRLEYRGYDSAGIAILHDGALTRARAEGKLKNLEETLKKEPISGLLGIGHTRWATHGIPNTTNAHPHMTEKVCVVHNGIIENFQQLRSELAAKGYSFESDTDTETIPVLITSLLDDGKTPQEAFSLALKQLAGAFAIAAVFRDDPKHLYAARRGSPLAIGHGEGEMYIASDAIALAPFSRRVTYLDEGDWAVLTRSGAAIFDHDDKKAERQIIDSQASGMSVDKENYRHFMLKEIHEQPKVIGDTLHAYIDGHSGIATMPEGMWNGGVPSRITIVACGTSYYAGMAAKYWIEKFSGVPVEVDIASEFRYRSPAFSEGGMFICISQSGETADTLAALRHAKANCQKTVAIVNVPESSIARESDVVVRTYAGPEIGVASTKAYTAQLAALACFAVALAAEKKTLDEKALLELSTHIAEVPARMAEALAQPHVIEGISHALAPAMDVLFVGRGTAYTTALEGALKLKEISYIHAEAYAAGELKHGPIALIDKHMPVVVVAPHDNLFEKTASNLQEIYARGGRIILVSDAAGVEKMQDYTVAAITMPAVDPFVAPLLYALPVQLLAYHVAVLKGTDVDQPRNLAKSVTVE